MNTNIRITQKQQETLGFLRDFVNQNGESPTITQIATGLGLKSLRSVTQRLESLEAKGLIRRNPFKHRGITLLDPFGPTSTPVGVERIAVIASAGCDAMQVYAQEQYDEFLMVGKELLDPRKEVVAIKAVGNSMVDFGLRNGDYALVEVTDDIKNGDRVVVIVGEMAVIKKFKKADGLVVLESESKEENYPPIVLQGDTAKIFGKVVRVIHSEEKSNNDLEYIPI